MKVQAKTKGQGFIEYALLLALISLIAIGGVVATGESAGSAFDDISTKLPDSGLEGTPEPTQAPTTVRVLVISSSGEKLEKVHVAAYNAAEEEVGAMETDSNGSTLFSDVADGRYIFRADYRGQEIWSETIVVPDQREVTITIDEKQLQVFVIDAHGQTLQGVPVYVFTESEDYIGQKGTTDQNGSVLFTLTEGKYKIRADYQAQETWSEMVDTMKTSSVHIRVLIAKFTVHVNRRSGGAIGNIPVYAFNKDGSYAGITARTSQDGKAILELPNGVYKFRADYGGSDYWSDIVTSPNVNSTSIYVGGVNVTVRVTDKNGKSAHNKTVYVYNSNGEYLNKSGKTDKNGSVSFELNDGSYRFRVTEKSKSYWSDEIKVPNTTNASIQLRQGGFTVKVTGKKNNPSSGVSIYIFRYSRSGHHTRYEYTGLAKYSDVNGQAIFDLSDGEYVALVYSSSTNYQWSSVFKIPKKDSVTVKIR